MPRLKAWLALLFLLLALPIAALVWHAYDQLKWEAFHQHRAMAEELSDRINSNLAGFVQQAQKRSFTDYSYLVVAGDSTAPFLQRSALSEYPVLKDIPGTIGYFQIDSNGQFSTPALPGDDTPPQSVGINTAELQARQTLATELLVILSENKLVDESTDVRDRLADVVEDEKPLLRSDLDRQSKAADSTLVKQKKEQAASDQENKKNTSSNKVDSQLAFDKLESLGSTRRIREAVSESIDGAENAKAIVDTPPVTQRKELNYTPEALAEEAYVDESEIAVELAGESDTERATAAISDSDFDGVGVGGVASVAATVAASDIAEVKTPQFQSVEPILEKLGARRITAFESEVDPIEFSLLDSGHFVAYRKVWREEQRLIQGVLIDRQALIDQLVRLPYQQASVSSMSSLSLTYQNNVLDTIRGADNSRSISYDTNRSGGLPGTLLYRNRLADPLNALELVFRFDKLPAGPGASVLAWVTTALAAVFLGGFYLLYRAGREQIALANQQQDFVSAVSHELKTPLTSIRLYGELLKEGWAPDEKKQQYYTFIHDESERLSRLIENVLKLARINRNELVLDLQSIEVSELMAAMQNTLQQQAGQAGFKLRFRVDSSVESMSVVVDKDSVMQILINLLDNAIKFSKHAEVQAIEISVFKYRNDKVALSVRDHGPGIPKDQLSNIFRMFYRSENELTRETVGTGIGLAIVHQLCVAMEAEVSVINREPGAEFLITFSGT